MRVRKQGQDYDTEMDERGAYEGLVAGRAEGSDLRCG